MIVGLIVIQAAAAQPPSEIRKTNTDTVVVSDVRYRGPDLKFPKPHNFDDAGVGYTDEGANLCIAAKEMTPDASAPTGWKMEAIIIKAAGIDIAHDDDATIKRKTKAWLDRQAGRNACTGTQALFDGMNSWLEAMIQPTIDGYHIVDEIILRYGLPLNDVTVRDGRTILDYVVDQMEASDGSRKDRYKRIYGTLRRLGARHRKELELAGVLAAPSQRAAQIDADLLKSAEAGNIAAIWVLTNRFATSGDAAKASYWLERALSGAKSSGDSITMTELGLALADPEGKARHPLQGVARKAWLCWRRHDE